MKKFKLAALAAFAPVALASMAHAADEKKPVTDAPRPPARASSLLQLQDGRAGGGNLIATTGIRGFTKPASANSRALILTVGDYAAPIPKLSGVPYDSTTATDIARRMGVPAANIKVLRDSQVTLAGLRQALDDLENDLSDDGQVFIYFSGHGGRTLVREPEGERCAEMLITADGQGMIDSELEQRLKRLSQKSQKTIVFLDACHSGGVTTRALGNARAPFTAKSYVTSESCSKPTNVLTRSLAKPQPPGAGGANFVHIAASRDSEISLDQPGRGGVASQAWLSCMAGAARDIDGSGGLSAAEIQACAQQQIERQISGAAGFAPHHVTITGNSSMVLSYAVKDTEAASAQASATAATAAPAPAAPIVPAAPIAPTAPIAAAPAKPTPMKPVAYVPPVPTSSPAAAPSPMAALNDIYSNRDDRRLVTITPSKTQLKIDKDILDFSITSREGGYLYLLMVGSDGKSFDLLFPNQLDRNNQLQPGASVRLPRSSWELTVQGPPGKDTLLAIVSDNPRDFDKAGLKPSGPFSVAQAVAAKDIQLVTAGATETPPAECSDGASTLRNLAIKKRCSTGYGAAMVTVEEVR